MRKIILLLCMLLAGCTATNIEKQDVTYHRTIDGDTVELVMSGKVEKVRLLLIDTPEKGANAVQEQPYAQEAKKRLEELLTKANKISVSFEKSQRVDKYGRLLAYVFVDEQLVQETLVKEGYARVAYYKGNERYYKVLTVTETYAKQHRLKIWSLDGYVTPRGYKK